MEKILCACIGIIGVVANTALAESYIWNPTTPTETLYLWSTPGNWTPSTSVAGPTDGDTVTVSGTTPQRLVLSADTKINSFVVDNPDVTLDLGGKYMSLAEGVTTERPFKIGIGDGTYKGPIKFVVTNGVFRCTNSITIPFSDDNTGSSFIVDNAVMTNQAYIYVGSASRPNNKFIIRNGATFYLNMPNNSCGVDICKDNTILITDPGTTATFNLSNRRLNLMENSCLIVSNGATANMGPSCYFQFKGPNASFIIDGQGTSWTQTGISGFNYYHGCKTIIKNKGTLKTNRLNFYHNGTGANQAYTNGIIEVLSGGQFFYINYSIDFSGIKGNGFHRLKVDGSGSLMSFNLYNNTYIRFISSSNRLDVTNGGYLKFDTNSEKAAEQRTFVLGRSSQGNVLSVDNGTFYINNPRAYIGYQGTNNVLSLANASKMTIQKPCLFTFGAGSASWGNRLSVKGINNTISLLNRNNTAANVHGTLGLVTSNSTEIAFIVTDNTTKTDPMLTITANAGEIDFRGITKAEIDDTEYVEAGMLAEVILLKIQTAYLTPGSITTVLETAAAGKGKITCTSDETYTYWKYKPVKEGLTVILR